MVQGRQPVQARAQALSVVQSRPDSHSFFQFWAGVNRVRAADSCHGWLDDRRFRHVVVRMELVIVKIAVLTADTSPASLAFLFVLPLARGRLTRSTTLRAISGDIGALPLAASRPEADQAHRERADIPGGRGAAVASSGSRRERYSDAYFD
jgi:hypothetical protein